MNKKIFLFGEAHGEEAQMRYQLEIWRDMYTHHGMRNFFVEYAYYTAELLNMWMRTDDDEILLALHDDFADTACHTSSWLDFYRAIKVFCQQTIFHGTDVGHQYDTIGERYLTLLEENNLQHTEQYRLAKENCAQGKHFYDLEYTHQDDDDNYEADEYRETALTENFIRAYEKLDDPRIMGVYGGLHVTYDVEGNMANCLHEKYGDILFAQDLSKLF